MDLDIKMYTITKVFFFYNFYVDILTWYLKICLFFMFELLCYSEKENLTILRKTEKLSIC